MLTEKRQEEILKLVNKNGSVTVQELKDLFDASESTIRRDLNALHDMGVLVKVFGGAVKNESRIQVKEEKVSLRMEQNRIEKQKIAQFAASLIEPDDFVYLDAGTTTGAMIPFIEETKATFVTNAVSHALMLAEKGMHVILIGGEMKASTEAIVGNEAYQNMQKYNFTKGFFGTNGVDQNAGFTTPDVNEALVKECAIKHSQAPYVLCDSAKFYQICPVRFAEFRDAIVITDCVPDENYKKAQNMIVV
ncbi:MAG: DeoR/GlpR transcriptional regulator [Agathobacter sp.]|nr:DeoR/GlpR transcriptional regulator [Agathobacter sp.]